MKTFKLKALLTATLIIFYTISGLCQNNAMNLNPDGSVQPGSKVSGKLKSDEISPNIKALLQFYDKQIYFTENKGQWPSDIYYKADFSLGQALVTEKGMIVGTFDPASIAARNAQIMREEEAKRNGEQFQQPNLPIKGHGWLMNFVNSSPSMNIETKGTHADVFNYLQGDEANHAMGVKNYKEVWYNNVYDNVDVRYYPSAEGTLEYDIVCKPGFDKNNIAINFDGIEHLHITAEGHLVLSTSVGDMEFPAPVAYQRINGHQIPVQARFTLTGNNNVKFEIGQYDDSQPLIIDPIALRWATWITNNSAGADHGHCIWVDHSDGSIYIAARIIGTGLITVNAFQNSYAGGSGDDIVLGKYTEADSIGHSGTRVWQTYLGGTAEDNPYAMEQGPDGNMYVVGYTQSTNFPLLGGNAFSGSSIDDRSQTTDNVFVVKFNTAGTSYKAAVVGGNGNDDPYDLRITSSGDIIVCGYTTSTNLATLFPGSGASNTNNGGNDVLIFKINSDLSSIGWIKNYGGSGNDQADIMLTNPNTGEIFVAGQTASSNFPTTNPRQSGLGGTQDGFIQKLNSSGTTIWSSYFKSASNKSSAILCMEFNQNKNKLYFGGITSGLNSSNVSSTGVLYPSYGGGTNDFFVVNMDTAQSFIKGTYLGGSSNEVNMMGLNTDLNDDVYIFGYTNSTNFPVTTNALQSTNNGLNDKVFIKIRTDLDSLEYSTYYGGAQDDYDPVGERGIKFSNCRIYTIVTSESNDLPLTQGAITTTKLSSSSIYEPGLVVWANPPDLLGNTISTSQTVCSGTIPANLTGSVPTYSLPNISRNNVNTAYPVNLGSASTYQWQMSTDSVNWTNIAGGTTQNLLGSLIGPVYVTTYIRRIIGGDACVVSGPAGQTVTIRTLSVPATVTNVTCYGLNNGSITANPINGTSPYSYLWSNGATTQTISNLSPGSYNVTVTDGASCTSTATLTITQPALLTSTATGSTVPCLNSSTGTVSANPSGGTSPYTYHWSTTPTQTTQTATGLTAGNYSVTVTDANGCSTTASATITEPSPYTITSGFTNVSCNGGNNGTAWVHVSSGGTPPYSYSWSTTPIQISSTATGLTAGNYTCTISDANNCGYQVMFTITQPATLSASSVVSSPILCNGGNATVTVSATGGTSPYTGTGTFTANAGTHTYTVSDANGCSTTTTITVNQPAALSASTVVSSPILCNGGNATVTVSATGGTSPYTGTGTFTTNAGTHTYTVSDANGCSTTTTITVNQPAALSASSVVSSPILCNGGNATVTVSATGGTSPYTGTGTFTANVGTHTYTVSDANGCSTTTTITVNQPAVLSASSVVSSPILCNGGNATVTVSATGGTSPYTGTGTFTANAGTHTYTVSDANGCSTTTTITVNQPAALSASSVVSSPILCNGGNATVTVSATGGTSPYTGTGTFTANAGTHTYTVSDAYGCSTTTTITVNQPAALSASLIVSSPILCNGGNATVTVSATGGTSPYTGTGTFTANAGTHTYTVSDANGCSTTTTITVNQPATLSASSVVSSPILCNGGNATVTVSATGGTSPYTGTGTFTANAGTHTYTVSDANGCSTTTTITVNQPAALSASSVVSSPILCNGGNATVTVSAAGGTSPYTGTGTFTANAGTHTYTVSDANGCSTTTTITVNQPAALSASSVVSSPILCNGGNATVTVSATGGTAPYTGTGTFTANAGTHTYTVSDANGCSTTTTISVNQPAALSSTITGTNVSCYGGNNGSASLIVSGGTTPYSFNWSNNSTIQNISGLTANTYSVTITDLNNCTTSASVIITQPNQVIVSIATIGTFCSGGQITMTASGANSYLWSTGATTTSITVNLAGTYSVTGTTNGCSASSSYTINVCPIVATVDYGSANGYSGGNAVSNVLVNDSLNGTSPVLLSQVNITQISTSNPNVTLNTSTGSVNVAAGTSAGIYNLIYQICDQLNPLNCDTAIVYVTVTAPQIIATVDYGSVNGYSGGTAVNNVLVNDSLNGVSPVLLSQVNLTQVSTSNVNVTLNTSNGSVNVAAGTPAGTYNLIYQICEQLNPNICDTAIVYITVTAPPIVATVDYGTANGYTGGIPVNNVLVNDSLNGVTPVLLSQVILTQVSTSNVNVTLNISNGSVNVAAGTPAGTYNLIYQICEQLNPNVCDTAIVYITVIGQLVPNCSVISNVNCFGGNNGSASVTVTGGVTPYSYLWSNGNTTNSISGLNAGTYSVTVTDAVSTTSACSLVISSPSPLVASSIITSAILCHGGNATVTVSATGGTSPYTGTGTFTANAGTHIYTVSDANGCSTTTTITVNQPAALSASSVVSSPILCNGGNATVTISATGGTSPYTGTGTFSASAGTHTYTVSDANGCSTTTTITVNQPAALSASSVVSSPILCNGGNATVIVSATGGTSPYTGTGTFTANAGTHTYTVSDANGCNTTTTITVNQPAALSASSVVSSPILCNGGNATVAISATGGTSPYTGTGTFTANAGTHSYTVSDANGCITTTTITVNQPAALSASSVVSSPILCNGGNATVTVSATGGTSPYTGTGTFTANAGTHTYTVSDANGCSTTTSLTVNQPALLSMTNIVTNVTTNGGNNGSISITVTGGTSPFTYLWSNGATTQNLTNLYAGVYSVIVTDANGCIINSGDILVSQPSTCTGFLTYTQGGWGTACHGNNPGCYRDAHFNNAFPNGLTIGCTNTLKLTSSAAVQAFLPSGSTPSALPSGTLINPGQGYSNVFAGQLVAATLNVVFDSTNINFSQNSEFLGHLTITSGIFAGWTVDSLLNEANRAIGGCGSIYSYSDLNTALDNINQNYDNGNVNGNFLTCSMTLLLSGTNILCNGNNTGAIQLTVGGGESPYSYLWSNGNTTQNLTGLSAGIYSVTVTDINGLTGVASITIIQPSSLNASSIVTSSILCHGGNATVTVSASGGTSPYTGTGTFSASAGTHTYTVTDANGCSATTTITVNQPAALSASSVVSSPILCSGGNATVTVSATGGTSPYTGTGTFTANAGTHTYTVSDANGCSATTTITVNQPAALSASSVVSSPILCSGGNATVTVSATGGTSPYTGTGTFTANAGTHTYTVSDANGCSTTTTITVNQPAALSASSVVSSPILCNGGNATVTVSATGGTSPYIGTGTFTANAGTHTYTVTDANGCSTTTTITVNQPAALSASSVVSSPILCSGGNATVTVSATGGTSPYTGTGTFTANAGTHTYTVSDANGCSTTTTITVNQPAALSASSVVSSPILCNGGNATLTVSATGGTAPYTGTGTFSASAGTHTYTVTDANGCSTTTTITVNQPAALSATISGTNVTCNGGNNGSASLTVSGGTLPYSYHWSNNAITQNISGITSGTYGVTITDAHGCTATATIYITQPSAITVTIVGTNGSSCNGGNGSATLTVTGGTSPYTYHWSNNATTQNLNNLSAGTYSVTVTDAQGCTAAGSVTITQTNTLTATISGTNVSCHGENNGSANLTVSGGTSPYSYHWSNNATTQNISGLSAGTYHVTVTDANGCTATASVCISQPAAITVTISGTNVSCNGGSDGSANATISGGTSPYSYHWSNNATNYHITGLSAGTYHVTVTDANGCTSTASIRITQPSAIVVTIVGTNIAACGCSSGSATLTVTGGSSPYSYHWSNNATTQNINGLTAGTYSVTVTDANGCTAAGSVTITHAASISISITHTNVTCHSGSDGTASLSVSGGTSPYSYHWSDNATTQNISGLSAGTYNVTVTDASGCTATASVCISQADAIVVTISGTNITCNGGNNGAANASVSGGTSPYSYHWSNNATTHNISNLSVGTYSVTVTDANGCTSTASICITQPSAIVVTIVGTNIAACGCSSGSATLTVTGGSSPYSYHWSNNATTQNINGLTAGTYSVTVTDANGCTAAGSVTITHAASISISISHTNVTCNGGSNGTATLSVSGGTSPYTYHWSDNATTQNISGLSSGTYHVTVTDASGCTATSSVCITQADAITLTVSKTNITCNGGNNGSANVTVSGGSSPYSYHWSNNATTHNISGLSAGTYGVTVTDANGCTATASACITQPAPIVVTITGTNISACGSNNGSASITVSGGTSPYSYHWSNNATTQNISGLCTGTYSVTVTDANGCTATASVVISHASSLTTSITHNNVSCNGGSDGSVTLTITGGTSPYTFNWSNGATTQNLTGVSSGTYHVTVTDASGCTSTASACITQPSAICATITGTNITCNGGYNGAANLSVSGGSSPYSYHWSNNATTQNISGLCAGTYNVTITDAHGCTVTKQVCITQPSAITISMTGTNVTTQGGHDGSVSITVSGGSSPYTYHWSNGATTQNICNLIAGTYCVTVTDANNCTASNCVTITYHHCGNRSVSNNDTSSNKSVTLKAYPNPFSSSAVIQFSVPEDGNVTLQVFNAEGAKVATLFDGQANGDIIYYIKFDAADLASGMYFYRLTTDKQTYFEKIMLQK